MRSIRRRGVLGAVVLAALVAPASALAAAPTVTTGGASNITPFTATVHGTIDPNGTATSYMFQIGPTKLYGGRTTLISAGRGNKAKKVSSLVSSLAPATTYHYRLVAIRGSRTWFGKDRTFKSKRQPLGVSLAATPNPIRSGDATTLQGRLTGTGSGRRQIVLLRNTWPYAGWVQEGNPQVTDDAGNFAFNLLSVGLNTQYQVKMAARPEVASPIVVLGTVSKVTRHARVFRGDTRGRIHFWGTITPALDGYRVQIQKLRNGTWVTVARTNARKTPKNRSRYSKNIRTRRGGRYRVVVDNFTGAHSPSVSRSIRRRHLLD